MRIKRLRLSNIRNIADVDVSLAEGINCFVGANGAGKTSIIEGAYLLSHGASFRTSQNNLLVSRQGGPLTVRADVERNAGLVALGLSLQSSGWDARVNGDKVANLAAALSEFALVCFEPGSHQLISGGSKERRRLLDWVLFHVEPSYSDVVRSFRKILRQRNELLRRNGADSELDLWDHEFDRASEQLTALRQLIFSDYAIELAKILSILLPELGVPTIPFSQGWQEGQPFIFALRESRERDRLRGHSTRGPHRADWSLRFENAPTRDELSRGQEKLCALACILAQARVYAKWKSEWPVVALDDFASELDEMHQAAALNMLSATTAQVLMSGIESPNISGFSGDTVRMFHVEHGEVKD